jgi:hypothetical protein
VTVTPPLQLMGASHVSMRDDFEISTPEIDALVDIIGSVLAGRGGVRLTGAGSTYIVYWNYICCVIVVPYTIHSPPVSSHSPCPPILAGAGLSVCVCVSVRVYVYMCVCVIKVRVCACVRARACGGG